MKLNTKFILITSVILIVISVSSTVIFYSLASNELRKQQVKQIVNSASDISFAFQNELQKTDEDFLALLPSLNKSTPINLDSTSIDFLFTLENDSTINVNELKTKNIPYFNLRSSSFYKMFKNNPNSILRFTRAANGKTYYYGNIVNTAYLNKLAQKIKAEVSLIMNKIPFEVSNPENNNKYLLSVVKAVRNLMEKNNYDIFTEELENTEFISAIYSPNNIITPGSSFSFIVFQISKEGIIFRNTLQVVMMLIIVVGCALTFIIAFVLTNTIRKQIAYLSQSAEITAKGNLEHRVPIITKDEIGKLGQAFNLMLDELNIKNKTEQEYSEFITLINQNPTLKEIADASLSKIIHATKLSFGVLYIVEERNLRVVSSFGISKNTVSPIQDIGLYSNALDKKEKVEFHFHENYPEIKTGIASIKLKYLLIYPIVYNKETIAVLELACESDPPSQISLYIDNISEQLAIGLVNAKSFEQLENVVDELRKLNSDYQKQNEQISNQNQELKELHEQLKEKAVELGNQKEKALELTKVKSEFLASMSHELRTPLISILGLTELLLNDIEINSKIKDRLNIVHRNGKKLLALINNILEFSKFETGKIELKKESFLLGDLIEEIYPNIQQLTAEKSLELILDLPKNKNVLLNSDKAKIEQVLLNLIVNAVKFTEKGFIRVEVKIEGPSAISFSVIDSGIGISEENKKIIFSEFKQVDGSISRKYGGAGLGLAISKKYVDLLGGAISLKSEIGKGSTFSFTLPEAILDVFEISKHEFLSVNEYKRVSVPDRNEKILIFNLDNASRQLVSDYLASYKLSVKTSSSFADTIILIQENKFKAVVVNPLIEDAWKLIAEVRKNNEINPELILTIINEDEKIGWVPSLINIMPVETFEKSAELILSAIEKRTGSVIERIYSYSKLKPKIINSSGRQVDVIESKEDGVFSNSYESSSSSLLLYQFPFLNPTKKNLENFLNDISDRKKNVLLVYSGDLENNASKSLNVPLLTTAEKIKEHPLDLLKVLRNKLKIETYHKSKITLIEEPIDELVPKNNIHEKVVYNSNPTILVVDDDNDALFTVGEFIKGMKYDTIYAHNGMECLVMLNHVVPDLILLDIMMPQMDGFETIKKIRSNQRFNNIPIVALTAYAMLDNKSVIEKNGFDDIVTKPINSQHLESTIKKYIAVERG